MTSPRIQVCLSHGVNFISTCWKCDVHQPTVSELKARIDVLAAENAQLTLELADKQRDIEILKELL